MSVRVVLASKNPGKRAELAALLSELAPGVELAGDEVEWPEVAETGTTFAENALLKARAVHDATGLLALADDSGLEVDALGGAPGVRSARFAGEGASDSANVALLLRRLDSVEDRSARFRCVIAVIGAGIAATFEGTVEGTIAPAPAGEGGFGYDPVFVPVGWDRTFAQAGPAQKALVSHRAHALRGAVARLRERSLDASP